MVTAKKVTTTLIALWKTYNYVLNTSVSLSGGLSDH